MDDAIRLENEKVESAQMSLELFCKFLQPFRDGNYLNLPVNVRYECQKWHLELTEHQTTTLTTECMLGRYCVLYFNPNRVRLDDRNMSYYK